MSEEQELEFEYGSKDDSSPTDEVPEYIDAEVFYGAEYNQDLEGSNLGELRWGECESALEDDEDESVEFLLDHEQDSAVMIPGGDADELEQEYDHPRYQVMGRRRPKKQQEEYEWEPIRDLSGPTDSEEAAANVVAAVGVAGFTATEATFKTVFEILTAAAR